MDSEDQTIISSFPPVRAKPRCGLLSIVPVIGAPIIFIITAILIGSLSRSLTPQKIALIGSVLYGGIAFVCIAGIFLALFSFGRSEKWPALAVVGLFGNICGLLFVTIGSVILFGQFFHSTENMSLHAASSESPDRIEVRTNSVTGAQEYKYAGEWHPVEAPMLLQKSDLARITGTGRFHGPFFVMTLYNGTSLFVTDLEVAIKVSDMKGAKLIDQTYALQGSLPPFSGGEMNVHSGREFDNLGPNGEHLADTCSWTIMRAHARLPPDQWGRSPN